MKKFSWAIISSFVYMTSCGDPGTGRNNDDQRAAYAPTISFSIIASYPHDTSSYTQGLMFYNDQLLEGTGLEGKSRLMQVDLKTGKAIRSIDLPKNLFGEGITVLNDTLFQLTWQNNKVLVYDIKDFKKIKEFPLNTEGWGITNDGKELIVTDGSGNLYFYEPSNFRLLRTQGVSEMGTPLYNLNELEYINGFVYANQYGHPYIYKIDPKSGDVVAKLNLTDLTERIKKEHNYADVLNGIAYHPGTDKIYITGKNWPEIYEIQFEH